MMMIMMMMMMMMMMMTERWHDENMRQQEGRIETRNFCDPIERRDVSHRTQELIPNMPRG